MFADVIVDITHSEVDKIFEYSFVETDCQVKLGSRVRVPFGAGKKVEGIVIGVKETSIYPVEKIKPIIEVLEETPALTEETLALTDFVCKKCYVTKASALRLFLPSEMRKGKIKEKFVKYACLAENYTLSSATEEIKKTAKKQLEAVSYLAVVGETQLVELAEKFGRSAITALAEKGIVNIFDKQQLRKPYENINTGYTPVQLTAKQLEAVKTVQSTDKRITLIHGVTGSGKTEVYLKLISDVIESGKTAIMLVPEIALTPQMFRQLRARFGDLCAILHSGLSAGERFDEWWRLRSGDARIAIGARSAIFAPLENVGLIVVDEEHDGSYSSESSPRYDTIDVAKFRAEYSNAKLVLGSATPSVDSYLKATTGEYGLIKMPDRINGKPLPRVEIADMRGEIRRGNNSPFSSALKSELEACLNAGNQAIIFLNQRGYSKTVVCTECGHVVKCGACDVSLTYHMEDNALLCHYCGAKYKMITSCVECGSKFLRYGGTGTERVVKELSNLFPNARILRMDRDTTQSKEGHFKILSEFSQKKADILVGTQMIAKGHDFPSVTLVGILDADASLHFSDYRSAERTFQLITQVAGRSGRAGETGKVVLQTYSPENPVLRQAVRYDYTSFFNREISVRKATGFPPYTKVVRVLISGEDEQETLEVTEKAYREMQKTYAENIDKFRFFGCMKAPIKRLQNKFRFQVLMRIETEVADLICDKIYQTVKKYNGKRVGVYLEINPNNLT